MGIIERFMQWLFGTREHPCALGCFRSQADPRCEARNCTRCCAMYCPPLRCGHRCDDIISDALRTAQEETRNAVILTCDCTAKNRVAKKDFGRGPICGRCKRTLRLPS